MANRPLFLDRDGVINKSIKLPDYLRRVDQFEFLPGTFAALQRLRNAGYDFYIITNQAGIARGQATVAAIEEIHRYMREELEKKGIEIQRIYVCPHRDEDNCACRKPEPGLLLQAITEQNLDRGDVIFVGDRETDMTAAQKAGVRGILIPSDVGLGEALGRLLH